MWTFSNQMLELEARRKRWSFWRPSKEKNFSFKQRYQSVGFAKSTAVTRLGSATFHRKSGKKNGKKVGKKVEKKVGKEVGKKSRGKKSGNKLGKKLGKSREKVGNKSEKNSGR